jgi:hypothetical protein
MASGWTNSGIDWTSAATMRESRTEDIVKHLTQATLERDYWISYTGQGFRHGSINPIIEDSRNYLSNAYNYIIETFRQWFMPEDDFDYVPNVPNTNLHVVPYNRSVFFDFDKAGVLYDQLELYYGYSNIDYSLNGYLETELGYSVDFVRDYDPSDRSFLNLDILKKIYDILNLRLYNRLCMYQYSTSFNGSDYTPSSVTLYKALNAPPLSVYVAGTNQNATTARNQFYAKTLSSPDFLQAESGWGSFNSQGIGMRGFGGATGMRYLQWSQFIYFTETGFDSISYDVSDFNFKCLSINTFTYDGTGDYSLLPFGEYVNGFKVYDKREVNNYSGIFNMPNGNYALLTEDKVTSGMPLSTAIGNEASQQNRVPFIDLNKEGFLNYYTEP